MKKNYRVAFYDWDGCIAKTLDIWLAASRKVLAEENIHPADRQIVRYFGNWRAFQHLGHSNLDVAVEHFLAYLRAELQTAELYPQVIETLKSLCQKGIKIAILSTSRRESIEATPAYRAINDCVEFFITAEDVVRHKPDPESIQSALAKLDIGPQNALIIGDSDKDIWAGHNAGIDSILFAPQEHERFYDLDELKAMKPTHCITDHRALLAIV